MFDSFLNFNYYFIKKVKYGHYLPLQPTKYIIKTDRLNKQNQSESLNFLFIHIYVSIFIQYKNIFKEYSADNK